MSMAKKALLIGINRYKIPGADLRGCVNDGKNMQAMLTQMNKPFPSLVGSPEHLQQQRISA